MLEMKDIQIKFKETVIESGVFKANYGQITGLIGKSGSGKSSLLNQISLSTFQNSFEYHLDGIDLRKVSEPDKKEIVRNQIAYLEQTPQFLQNLNCYMQVASCMEIAGLKEDSKRIHELLEMVGIKPKAYPNALSGGEKQRLAIVMAVAKEANIILCDEVTSALDSKNTNQIIDLLKKLAYEKQKMIILTSHDASIISKCDVIYEIKDQKIHCLQSGEIEKVQPTIQNNNMESKILYKIPFLQMKRKPISHFLLMVVSSIVVAALTCSFMFHYQEIEKIRRKVNLTPDNEMMVIHKGEKDTSYVNRFDESNFPFEKGMLEKIENVEYVTSVYPYFEGMLLDNNQRKETIQILKDGEVISNTVLSFEGNKVNLVVSPYYPEQEMQTRCLKTTSNHQGVYLSKYMLEDLGIENLEEGMSIQANIYLPVAYSVFKTQRIGGIGTIGQSSMRSEIEMAEYIYQPVSIHLDISGIIAPEFETTGKHNLMIPYNLMVQYQKELQNQYQLKENEFLGGFSAYQVYMDDGEMRQTVKENVLKISQTLACKFSYLYEKWTYLYQDEISFFYFYSVVELFMIVVGMMFVYGLLNREMYLKDLHFFKNQGLSQYHCQQMLLNKAIILGLGIFTLSLVNTYLLFENGISWDNQFKLNDGFVSVSPIWLLISNMMLSMLLAFVSEIKNMIYVKKGK